MDISKAKQLRKQGKSYREIGKALKVSHTTVAKKLKFQQPEVNADNSHLFSMSFAIPGMGGPRAVPGVPGHYIVPSPQQHAGIYSGGKRYYVPADRAIIENRENARNMWDNLLIRSALQSRLWAAAEQSGHVEPEDKKDEFQVAVAEAIQNTIDNIPDILKLKYCLLKSRWYGAYGIMLKYEWKGQELIVKNWIPVNGDSILFKQDTDDIAVYTTTVGSMHMRHIETEAGYIGRAHHLEDGRTIQFDDQGRPYQNVGATERQAFILMTYDPDPSDFLNSRQAGGVKGLGIRSTLYPTWYIMQEILGNLMDWIERVGSGILMYKFLRGNESSYQAAQALAESQSNQAVVMVPVDPESTAPGGKPWEGIEYIEVGSTGMDNMLKVLDDYFGNQIREFIIGQPSTSKPVNTGMGSKTSEVHENTFSRIIHFDCQDLAGCLTRDLVSVLQEWNHPETMGQFKCKYVIDADRPDVKAQMEAVKAAYECGVSFDMDEVRGLCGLSKPNEDAEIIQKAANDPMGGTDVNGINQAGDAIQDSMNDLNAPKEDTEKVPNELDA